MNNRKCQRFCWMFFAADETDSFETLSSELQKITQLAVFQCYCIAAEQVFVLTIIAVKVNNAIMNARKYFDCSLTSDKALFKTHSLQESFVLVIVKHELYA